MKIVLLRDVAGLGRAGEQKIVKDGYAINFLFPHQLAAVPGSKNAATVQRQIDIRAQNLQIDKKQREQLAKRFSGQTFTIPLQAGSSGKLYGSITAVQLAELLNLDKRYILLPKPIRTLGDHTVLLKFGDDMSATITVTVVEKGKTG